MDAIGILALIGTFLGWGVGGLFAKMASNRIGSQAVFWDVLGYVPMIIIFTLVWFRVPNLLTTFQNDRLAMVYAILAGSIGAIGGISYYVVVSRADLSSVAPMTALYPAVTVLLAFLILHETISTDKIIGVILSLAAIFFLAR
jgi:bacterial/archaeal transporter family protein